MSFQQLDGSILAASRRPPLRCSGRQISAPESAGRAGSDLPAVVRTNRPRREVLRRVFDESGDGLSWWNGADEHFVSPNVLRDSRRLLSTLLSHSRSGGAVIVPGQGEISKSRVARDRSPVHALSGSDPGGAGRGRVAKPGGLADRGRIPQLRFGRYWRG